MPNVLSRYASFLHKYLIEILAVVVTLAVVVSIEDIERSRIVAEERDRAVDQLNLLQQQLGASIIADLHLLEGLRIRLTQKPSWTQQEFGAYVGQLIADHRQIRHIAIAEDYVVKYIAPLAGNEAAIGMDYRLVPEQLEAVEEVIGLGHTVITDVVDLVQGGTAIIGRVPYFVSTSEPGSAWGLIAIVWNLDSLFKPLADFNANSPYHSATRSIGESVDASTMIYGEASVFEQEPARIVLQLEGNTWEIAVVPKNGWSPVSNSIWIIRATGLLVLSLVVSLSVGRRRKSGLVKSLQREIIEREQVGLVLKEIQDRVSLILDSIPVGITYVDASQVYRYANRKYLQLVNKREDEVLGKPVSAILNSAKMARSSPYFERVLQGESTHFENTIDEDIDMPMHYTVDYIPHLQPDGSIPGYFAMINDITELREHGAALVASELRFRTIFDTIGGGMLVIDREGIIQSFNPAAEAMFGYNRREVAGKNVSVLLPEKQRSAYLRYLKHYLVTGKASKTAFGNDMVGLRKSGEKFPVHVELNQMIIDDETFLVGSFDDLTEIQSLENQLRQAQKLEAVGQLTGGIAHDFNNLLAVIQGNLSLLVDEIRDTDSISTSAVLNLVGPAIGASERGAELAQRLLAFSRKQSLHPQVEDVNERVANMEGMLRRSIGQTVDLKIVLKSGTWRALVDPSLLESAILNLALNARDATMGGGRLTIETSEVHLDRAYAATHPDASVGDYILLTVADTGSGIDPDTLERVFDPFFTTKEVGKGSGLGLSMVHGFVKQSGGHILIDSKPGEGTNVRVYLPRSLASVDTGDTTTLVAVPGGQETILVVEDEEAVRLMTVRMLERFGYNIIEASDGEEAMKTLENTERIDLLLTDVVLPGGMSGPDIASKVSEMRPDMKILFMSGYTESTMLNYDPDNTNIQLLSKPFSMSELASKVRESIEAAA